MSPRARRHRLLWWLSRALDRVGIPALRFWPHTFVAADVLESQVTAIFHAWGMPEDQIPITVEHLLYADLHGIDSHGSGMLRHYHRLRAAGTLNMTPRVEVVREDATTALVDGGGGLGHVPGDQAMTLAIAKARDAGAGVVAVRNSGHFGAAGAYAAMAARAGCLGIATTSTEQPSVVPTFGVEAVLGTNPIAFAAPAARNRPFMLDMATSTVPIGALYEAWREGRSIPEGWAFDEHGAPITNARRAAAYRRLAPLGSTREMGSHKGYGLAAMVEILSRILPGSGGGPHGRHTGHLFIAIDPRRFRDDGEFEAGLDTFMDGLRATRPREADQPVMVAGDPEYAALEERRRAGIPLARGVIEDIRMICADGAIPFLIDQPGELPAPT